MSTTQQVCPVPFDGQPTSLAGLVERFFRRCVEDLTRVNAPKQSKCSAGLRDSLARVGIQLQSTAPVNVEGCLVAQSNSVGQLDGPEQQQRPFPPPANSSEPNIPLWLCPGHIRPGQITRFPTSPDLIYVDIDGQETIFFRNASNPCANRDQLCPKRERIGRLFDLPKSSTSQFSVYLHGCLTLGDQRRCGYLDLRLPPSNSRDRFRLDSIRQGVTCPGGKVLLDNALQLFPTSSSSTSSSPTATSTTTSVGSISTTTSRPPGGTAPPATSTATATSRGATSTSSRSTTTANRSTTTQANGPPLPVPSPPGAGAGAPETEVTATIPPPPPSSSNGLEEGSTEGIAPSSIALIFLSIVAVLGMSVAVANFHRQRKKRAIAAARRESVVSISSAEAPTPPTLPPPLPALQHLHFDRKGSANSDGILSGLPIPGDQRITPVNLMRSIPSATFAPGGGSGALNPASMTLGRQSVKGGGGGFERVDGVEYIHISSLVTADEIARASDEPLQQIVDSFESIFMQLEAHVRSEIASDPSSPASSNVRTSHALETVQMLRDRRAERLIVATSSLLAKATGRPVVPGAIPDGLGAKFLGVLTAMAKYDKESILFTVDRDERLSEHTRTARVYHIMGDVPRPTVVAATVMPGWMRSDGEVMVAVRVAAASTGDG